MSSGGPAGDPVGDPVWVGGVRGDGEGPTGAASGDRALTGDRGLIGAHMRTLALGDAHIGGDSGGAA
jgi:hypothetical protein